MRPIWITSSLLLLAMVFQPVAAQPDSLFSEDFFTAKKSGLSMIDAREKLDLTLWKDEITAQHYESRIVQLWDQLRASNDKFHTLAAFPFSELILGKLDKSENLQLGIQKHVFGVGERRLTPEQLAKEFSRHAALGYAIDQSEWHHNFFSPGTENAPAMSEISYVLHISKEKPSHRVILKGQLRIEWNDAMGEDGFPVANRVSVMNTEMIERQGDVAFQEVFVVKGTDKKPRVLPIVVHDLNNDGYSEIIVGGQNMVIRNMGEGKFNVEQFLADERSIFDAAILADFTGDANEDFIAVDTSGFPILFEGDAAGNFPTKGRRAANASFKLPKTFTAGDIDADGDLDLYIGNYKYAYRQGQMPSPYFDANDGYPAYLLLNDGKGNFTDNTDASGLGEKRYRRAYSSSFVDLDDDRDLDLIVVSDYAGFDVYLNDGKGLFKDVTDAFGMDHHFFGMGHTFSDYNNDGFLDFYIIGMSSTTARRLERMELDRLDKPEHTSMRAVMGYGNRLFLGGKDGFKLADFNSDVARTGWSWGASSFDFDNDGDKDIFVTNGHYSGKSSQDYCTTFWRHDIYDEGKEDLGKDFMFQQQTSALRKAEISWNGFEHKVLLMNREGDGFINIAYLLGVSFEYDARAAITEDLDGDGRMDLLVVEFKTEGLDKNTYNLHVYKNQLEQAGNWIGLKLDPDTTPLSPIGATIKISAGGKEQFSRLVTGDSFSSQHSATAHFGLGDADKVDFVEVELIDGHVQRLEAPSINQYHYLRFPASDGIRSE